MLELWGVKFNCFQIPCKDTRNDDQVLRVIDRLEPAYLATVGNSIDARSINKADDVDSL